MNEQETREALAALAHIMWSGWMDYMFSRCAETETGDLVIPAVWVERWRRQVRTPYQQLTFQEQESDREEADKMLDVLAKV